MEDIRITMTPPDNNEGEEKVNKDIRFVLEPPSSDANHKSGENDGGYSNNMRWIVLSLMVVAMGVLYFIVDVNKKNVPIYEMAMERFEKGDHPAAFALFVESAELGFLESKYMLGRCYEDGLGCDKDIKLAIKWYNEVPDYGDVEERLYHCYSKLIEEQYALVSPIIVESPSSFNGHVLRGRSNGLVSLQTISCEYKYALDDGWLSSHQLDFYRCYYTRKTEYDFVPAVYGGIIRSYIDIRNDYCVVAYGNRYNIVFDKNIENVLYIFDFRNLVEQSYNMLLNSGVDISHKPSVCQSVLENGVLYVRFYHDDSYYDARSPKNDYIIAINVADGKINWMSNPLTCNSNFVVVGNSIICGYGGSGKPDYVYVLDKHTGQRVQKILIKDAADYFAVSMDSLYIRTYEHEYVMKIKY